MIAQALNPINREILLAYLHLLHFQERLTFARRAWVYRAIQAHWLRAPHLAHWL